MVETWRYDWVQRATGVALETADDIMKDVGPRLRDRGAVAGILGRFLRSFAAPPLTRQGHFAAQRKSFHTERRAACNETPTWQLWESPHKWSGLCCITRWFF